MTPAEPLAPLPDNSTIADALRQHVADSRLYHELSARHNALVDWVKRQKRIFDEDLP